MVKEIFSARKGMLFLAFDLGAESGRAVAGHLEDGRLEMEVVHRFVNRPALLEDGFYWDILSLYNGILDGMMALRGLSARKPVSVSCDSWGVDFALIDRRGRLMGNPRHYRDPFFCGAREEVFKVCAREELYSLTGIHFLPFNTIYQLFSLSRREPDLLETADKVLMIADFFNFLLGAEKKQEYSLASTSGLCEVYARNWSETLFRKLSLPLEKMPEIIPSATVNGFMRQNLREQNGWHPDVPVIAGAGHDTAAAVTACPADKNSSFAYLSSGTWSLLGIEKEAPEVGPRAMEQGFTNEGGTGGRYRFLRNISGLWILQECRRRWMIEENREIPYAELVAEAAGAPAFFSLLDVDEKRFLSPRDMVDELVAYFRETGQAVPPDRAGMTRVILEGLALRYMVVFNDLKKHAPDGRVDILHIIGGGSQNDLLNRFTAAALGVPVMAGPVESTAAGNILSQAMAVGEISDLDEARQVIKNSFSPTVYEPGDFHPWREALARLEKTCSPR